MKLVDWITRRAVAVGFDQRGGGLVVSTTPDSVELGGGVAVPAATAAAAGVMRATDKSRLDSLANGTGTLDPAAFATRLQAEASDISDPQIGYLRTAGHTAAGDGGGALFARTAGEPAHTGKLQSNDGSWWEQIPENRMQDYRAFGGGAGAINDAITFMAMTGGGTVLIPEDTSVAGQIVARDNVSLEIPSGVTLALNATVSGGFIVGTDVPDFRVTGGGRILPNGNATYALHLAGRSRFPIDGLEITGHKGGIRIEASAASGIGDCVIRDLHAHGNFVHPTSPATQSQAGHALSITCRPSQGYDLTERVVLENVVLEGVAAGATDGSNQYTKDLLSVQGAKVLWIDGFVSRRSGEVGLSATFGCQHVTIRNAQVEEADGHGIILSGAHYRLDLSGAAGTFVPGETVTGGTTGATGSVEYVVDGGDGTTVMWLQSPSRAKVQAGETIAGGSSLATATVDASWFARKLECLPSVRTRGNGIDVHGIADYAGVTAQHVEQAALGGTHEDNKPFGMIANSSDFRLLANHCPVGSVQTAALNLTGSSEFLGQPLGPLQVASPASASGSAIANAGVLINGQRQIEGAAVAANTAILNRTGSAGSEFGDVIRIARNGLATASIGTDGLQFPQNTSSSSFSHSSLPGPAGVPRKINFSVSSRGGAPALVRSDGARHIDLVSGLPSRASVWTRAAIEAEAGAIAGGAAYTPDGAGGNPALSVWTGTAWRHLSLTAKAGTTTISDGSATVAVNLVTPMSDAGYAITLAPHGAENVWISAKSASGFVVNRAGSTGSLDVDWAVVPPSNP